MQHLLCVRGYAAVAPHAHPVPSPAGQTEPSCLCAPPPRQPDFRSKVIVEATGAHWPIKPIDAEREPIKQVTLPRGYVLCVTPPHSGLEPGPASSVALSAACAGCGRAGGFPPAPRAHAPLGHSCSAPRSLGGGSSFHPAQWPTLTQASATVHTNQASPHSHRPRNPLEHPTGSPHWVHQAPGTNTHIHTLTPRLPQAGTDQGAAGICTPHMVLSAGMALGRELVQLNQLGEIDLGKISKPSAHSQGDLIIGWGRQVGLASVSPRAPTLPRDAGP